MHYIDGKARTAHNAATRPVHSPLHHDVVGEGEAVVLISGLGGLGTFWRPVAERMAPGRRVLSFDHPGVGRSADCGPQRIQTIVAQLLHLLDALGIEHFSCVGHSTGGLVAQALALDHPARVRALVLSSTWGRPDRRFRDLFHLRRHVLERAGGGAYAAFGRLLGYPAGWYEAELAQDAALAFEPPPAPDAALIASRIDMLLNYERADELGALQVPALVIGAVDDQIVPFHHAQDLAARIPGARLVELSGGHFVPTVRPDDFCRALGDFLETT